MGEIIMLFDIDRLLSLETNRQDPLKNFWSGIIRMSSLGDIYY